MNLNYNIKLEDMLMGIGIERGPFDFGEKKVVVENKEGECTRLFMYSAI